MEDYELAFKELKEKLGIKAFEDVSKYIFTLVRKIEDLTSSREKWKNKFLSIRYSTHQYRHRGQRYLWYKLHPSQIQDG